MKFSKDRFFSMMHRIIAAPVALLGGRQRRATNAEAERLDRLRFPWKYNQK